MRVVKRLHDDLAPLRFIVLDHWEADRHAIGLAAPDDHQRLAYISTWAHPDGEFDFELEVAPQKGADRAYDVVMRNGACDYSTLRAAIKRHLSPPKK